MLPRAPPAAPKALPKAVPPVPLQRPLTLISRQEIPLSGALAQQAGPRTTAWMGLGGEGQRGVGWARAVGAPQRKTCLRPEGRTRGD